MADQQRISANEAAARLGVKRETLYAYVSRGLLESRTLDGKTSTFDPAEVERLQRRRRTTRTGVTGIPIVSAITKIEGSTISYRGHDVERLVADAVAFEDVAVLLWTGAMPDGPGPRPESDATLIAGARAVQDAFPAASPFVDRLRATAAFVSASDPLRADLAPRSIVRAARALLDVLVDALPLDGARPAPRASIAERLWPRLTPQRATSKWRRALDAALVLLADHDLAASTFAARVAASARADVYSIVAAGLGPLGGALHGAASAPLHRAFAASVTEGPAAAAAVLLRDGVRPTGFGHFLYPDGDPRARVLLPLVREAAGDTRRAARVFETIALLHDRVEAEPNIDCALAAMSALAQMRDDAGEAVFAIARTAGWVAHGLAELEERPLRFRPVSRWVG